MHEQFCFLQCLCHSGCFLVDIRRYKNLHTCAYSYMSINWPLPQTSLSLVFLFCSFQTKTVKPLTIAHKPTCIPSWGYFSFHTKWMPKFTAHRALLLGTLLSLFCFVLFCFHSSFFKFNPICGYNAALSILYLHPHSEATHPQIKLRLFRSFRWWRKNSHTTIDTRQSRDIGITVLGDISSELLSHD